jgi:hypothetical protein
MTAKYPPREEAIAAKHPLLEQNNDKPATEAMSSAVGQTIASRTIGSHRRYSYLYLSMYDLNLKTIVKTNMIYQRYSSISNPFASFVNVLAYTYSDFSFILCVRLDSPRKFLDDLCDFIYLASFWVA